MNRLALLAGLGVLLLLLIPVLAPGIGSWGGTDGTSVAVIEKHHPTYEPWFDSLWKPPSREIGTVLFSLQAGIGGGIIGYVLRGFQDA